MIDLAGLSTQERDTLIALLSEANNRGLRIELGDLSNKPAASWPMKNGYFLRMDGAEYNPTYSQAAFITSNAIYTGFWGSRGSGKSSAGSQKASKKIRDGQNGIIANPDFENLKISTWPEFREWCPWEMVVSAHQYRKNPEWQPHQPFVHAFRNGVRVIVKGVKDPHSARGPNVNWFWFDEAQRTDDALAWQTAIASVRVGKNPQSWATFTPNGTDHWTTEFFINKNIPDDAFAILKDLDNRRVLIEDFHGTMHDNQANLSPTFIAAVMAAYPEGWLRDQEVFGKVVKREGALGNPTWFDEKVIPAIPDDVNITGRVRYWDLAATEKKLGVNDPDETVGTLMSVGRMDDKRTFFVEDQVAGHWEWEDIKSTILDTAIKDGPYVKIFVEQEPGSGGKNQVAELKNWITERLPNVVIDGHDPKRLGDKVMRANVWFSEAYQGNIYLLSGLWVAGFLKQLGSFPFARHDDKIDSVSGARHTLAPIAKWSRMTFLKV